MSNNNRIYYSVEAEQKAKRQNMITSLLFTALGIVIGSAAALLLAPKDGETARQMVADTFESGVQRGRENTNQILNRLQEEIPLG